jgi:tetratricopeptide (TPR) repeat protein
MALKGLGDDAPRDLIGRVFCFMGQIEPDYDRARHCFEKAAAMCRGIDDSRALLTLGIAWLQLAQEDRAFDALNKALSLPAGPVERGHTWFYMGYVFLALRNYREAADCFMEALETPGLRSGVLSIYEGLATAYQSLGDKVSAAAWHEKAMNNGDNMTPGSADRSMADACAAAGDYTRAIEFYRKALDAPGFEHTGEALHGLGTCLANRGDYADAFPYFQRALDTPGYADPGATHHAMAELYTTLCDYPRAIESCRRALAIPDYLHATLVQQCLEEAEAMMRRRGSVSTL